MTRCPLAVEVDANHSHNRLWFDFLKTLICCYCILECFVRNGNKKIAFEIQILKNISIKISNPYFANLILKQLKKKTIYLTAMINYKQ